MDKITTTIRQLRKKKGFTQKSIAERLHMARSTYSKIESGNTALDYERLVNISKVLDVPVSEIIKENGDPVFKSIAEELSLMLLQTDDQLSEKLYRMIQYQDLKPEHKKLLQEKGFDSQEAYENTPLGGRIYAFGPKDVFLFMVQNCGMEVLFQRNMILNDYWTKRWKTCLKREGSEIEIDDRDYFVTYIFMLKMPGNKERWVQFAERDFPEGADEWDALDYLKEKTGALDGKIMCWGKDGYDPVTEIIK